MQEKSGFHQRKPGISCLDRNKCRRFFVCLFLNGSLAWNQLGDVVSVGSSNVKAIDDESFVLFFPIAWKIVSPLLPLLPPNQIAAKQAAVNRDSRQDEFEVLQALWNRIHKNSTERVTGEGAGPSD